MQTEKLYYQDAYRREFAAHVVGSKTVEGRAAVALDRTAFYATGGGQPYDTGTLDVPAQAGAVANVVDVIGENGVVWHVLVGQAGAGLAEGAEVRGAIDWGRRFDHMQQHTGQHVLSEAFIKERNARTVAFHLGADTCTIDLDRTDLTRDDLAAVETAANAVLDEARPVTATFVDDAELARLPLRKMPSVEGPIRIVEVAGYDWSPCGGTHVKNSAEIGLIAITGTEKRGPELRVTFLCGRRAREHYARLRVLADGLVARFSTGQGELLDAVDRALSGAAAIRKDLGELEGEWAEARAAALYASAEARGSMRVVCQAVDYPVERARRVAMTARSMPGAVVLFGVRGDRPQLLFGRADDVKLDCGALLRAAAATVGGRGGGRPEWAQGGAPDNAALERALAAALSRLQEG